MDEKKYTFVRIKDKTDKNSSGMWYLKADSEDTIMEHWFKYCKDDIQKGVRELFDIKCCGLPKHYTSNFGALVSIDLDLKGGNVLSSSLAKENEILKSRIKFLHDGCEQYLTKGMTVFMLVESLHEVVETIESHNLVYPDEIVLTLDQVKYSQWEGFYGKRGVHWYAKIGNLDIVDKNGNVKWNTREEAEEAAKAFIVEHNSINS